MHSALHSILIDYGLSEIEASIYLTLLEIGRATAQSIHRITNIDLYSIEQNLEEMYNHEYVFRIPKDGIYHYMATNPEEMINKRKEACIQLEACIQQFDSYDFAEDLAQMESIYHIDNESSIAYYEGVSGLIQYYHEHIIAEKPVYAFISPDSIHPVLLEYLYQEYVPQRVEKNIPVLAITDNHQTEKKNKYVGLDIESLRETTKIDNPLFQIAAGINIFGINQVGFVMYSHEEMSALIITSKKLYETLQSIFLLLRHTDGYIK